MTENNKFKISEIKFSTDFQDTENQKLFREVEIKAFASGENMHTLPVSIDVLKRGSETIYNKPILWRYSSYLDDALGHEEDEVPCGFVPEREDNPVVFVEEQGKTFLTIKGWIWTRYCGRLIEIFERDDNEKNVSVEISGHFVKRDGGDNLLDYVIAGITILGEWINPAVEGCKAEMKEFSEAKEQFLNTQYFAEGNIKIDNTKASSVSGSWENPRRKLFNPIVEASNSKSLLEEAYLVVDTENPTISNSKYPHHVIRDGKLVIHVDGLQSALQRASQQNIVNGGVKAHLLRHYRELDLNTENFSELGFSEESYKDLMNEINKEGETMMKNDLKKISFADKATWSYIKDTMKERLGTEIDVVDVAKDGITYEDGGARYHVPHNIVENVETNLIESIVFEDAKLIEGKAQIESVKYEEPSIEELREEYEELKEKYKELKESHERMDEENKTYMSKVEAMADYEDLRDFKAKVLEEKAEEERVRAMNTVYSELEEKGVSLSEENKEELSVKFSEYGDNLDGWKNYVKAFAFDNAVSEGGMLKMGLPINTPKKSGGLWDWAK